MKKYLILSAASLALASLSGFADDADPGKALWDKQCKKCHGESGDGATKLGEKLEIKDYTDPAVLAEFSDEELFDMTKDGIEGTKMKGYGNKLSDEEIQVLVAYMRSLAKS